MITIRHSEDRGPANHGWLQSWHTFSFANYYDPKHMGVSVLRVINDDKVAPGAGFGAHSHQDMEIISYVKKGTIEHKDSMGNVEVLPAGEFQLMSAGSGVTHSEYNPSKTDALEFLQIWIIPNELGIKPQYQQKHFGSERGLKAVITPDGSQGSLLVHQDAYVYQLITDKDTVASHSVDAGRTVYVHLISGEIEVNGESLSEGDGATISAIDTIEFIGKEASEALVFDLP